MRDLKTSRWMWVKAVLFVVIGVVSCALILAEYPDWHVAVLLALAIWAFCRAYYFAFYVIEKHIDPEYRFSGLISVLRYLLKR
jgi:uncharacterized membrane protein